MKLDLSSEEKGVVARLRTELSDLRAPEDLAGIAFRSLILWLTYVHHNRTDAGSMRPYISGARASLNSIERLTQEPDERQQGVMVAWANNRREYHHARARRRRLQIVAAAMLIFAAAWLFSAF